ncbi:MAG: NAD(P)/FAD-dependent oxidoreductase [Ferrimicrobium sp.]
MILGAGLRVRYRLHDTFGVTLIDPRSDRLAKPTLPEVALSGKPVAHARFPLAPIARRTQAQLTQASATSIDPVAQRIQLDSHEAISYDFLVIAVAAVKDYSAIEGLEEFGYSVCDDDHAPRRWDALSAFKGGPIVVGAALSTWGTKVAAPDLKAPCEGPIGEGIFMAGYELRSRRIAHTISAFTPGDVFFDDVGDNVHASIAPLLGAAGVEVLTAKSVRRVAKGSVMFTDGTELESELTVVIPPYRGPKMIVDSGLGDEVGFVPVNEQMQAFDYSNIFVAGDVSALAMPKLGLIAVHQADVAVAGLQRMVGDTVEIPPYRPEVFCIMNRGGSEATLILSDIIHGGERDIAKSGPLVHFMKWSFDAWGYHTHGHLPPDLLQEALEKFLP